MRTLTEDVQHVHLFTIDQLMVGTGATLECAAKWHGDIHLACYAWGVNTLPRLSAFFAQIAIESQNLTATRENMNYSAERLLEIFGSRFDSLATAVKYAHRPEMIANRVYGGRYGNGDEASGDGWKYRGGGLGQLTFRDNYAACQRDTSMRVLDNPDLMDNMHVGAMSAGWYFHWKGCAAPADAGNLDEVVRLWTGGKTALRERRAFYAASMDSMKGIA